MHMHMWMPIMWLNCISMHTCMALKMLSLNQFWSLSSFVYAAKQVTCCMTTASLESEVKNTFFIIYLLQLIHEVTFLDEN